MDLSHFQPILKNKYLVIMLLSVVLGIIAPSYLADYDLWTAYIVLGFVTLVTFGLYQNIRFQKLLKILRPFIVTRILQVVVSIAAFLIFARTLPAMIDQSAYVPYGIFYLLILALVYQFYSIFYWAKKAKKDFPDRCEFC